MTPFFYLLGDKMSLFNIITWLILWTGGGLVLGYAMKLYLGKKGKTSMVHSK
jgi:hypothetical protein